MSDLDERLRHLAARGVQVAVRAAIAQDPDGDPIVFAHALTDAVVRGSDRR